MTRVAPARDIVWQGPIKDPATKIRHAVVLVHDVGVNYPGVDVYYAEGDAGVINHIADVLVEIYGSDYLPFEVDYPEDGKARLTVEDTAGEVRSECLQDQLNELSECGWL